MSTPEPFKEVPHRGLITVALMLATIMQALDTTIANVALPTMTGWGAGIMLGRILGPTLGGWLTENFNWGWVFFINLPVGILAFLGMAAYLPSIAKRTRSFDFFGFAMISRGVGALQLLLDRG